MSGVNKAIIVGHLGQDPEIRATSDGRKIAIRSEERGAQMTKRNSSKVTAKSAKVTVRPPKPRAPAAPSSVAGVQPTRFVREIKLDKIVKRKDMGDLTALAKSIDDRGALLQPIVITADNQLIAGQRRLAAWSLSRRFHRNAIPVHVVSVDSILKGERDENEQRKDFSPSEHVALMEALLPELEAEAKARTQRGKAPLDSAEQKGAALDLLGQYLGRDRKTLQHAKEVVEAAKSEPDKYQELVDYMEKHVNVNGPLRRQHSMNPSADIADKKASGKLDLPAGKFDRIVADMPWAFEPDDDRPQSDARAQRPYATISHKAMCAMGDDIKARVADDCVLLFWCTNFHMPYAYEVLKAWGFEKFPTILTWVKGLAGAVQIGRGRWLRDATEHCIIAIKGNPAWQLEAQPTVLFGARRANSQKPDEFYALIEHLAPAQRSLELFARRELPAGWEGFGDQVGTLKDRAALPQEAPAENASAVPQVEPVQPGEPSNPAEVGGGAGPEPTELEALETIDNERALSASALAKLKEQKLVRGSAKPKLTKAGIARLVRLREPLAELDGPLTDAERIAGGLEPADPIMVFCRVCSDGTGLCVECLAADDHVVTHTNPNGEAIATCSCGWRHATPWGDHHEIQDRAIKEHWQTVVDVARQAESGPDVREPQETRPPESSDDDGLGIPNFCKRPFPAEAAE